MANKTVSDRAATIILEKIVGQPASCEVNIQSSEGSITGGVVSLGGTLTAVERNQLQNIAAKLIAAALSRDGYTG